MLLSRFKHCVLHIGFEKTGSTSIQAFLTDNIPRLREQGYFVPRSLSRGDGFCNHTRLAAYAIADHKLTDDLRLHHGVNCVSQTKSFREETTLRLDQEAEQATGCHTMLLSSEHLSSRTDEPGEIVRLKALLDGFCDDIKIVAYLRSQAELLPSIYNEAVKAGFHDLDLVPDFDACDERRWVTKRYFDYATILELWSGVFGRDHVMVRLFEPGALLFGDVVQDFLFSIHIDPSQFKGFQRLNQGLNQSAQRFLQGINRSLRALPPQDETVIRQRVIDILMDKARGRGRRLTLQQTDEFLSMFRESNERVRLQWFPQRAELFSTASASSDAEEPAGTDMEETFRIVTLLLRALLTSG